MTFTKPGGLVVTGGSALRHMYGVRQAAPQTSFTAMAQMRDAGTGADLRPGVFVGIAGGKGNVCGPFSQDNALGAIGVTTVSDTADWSGYDGYLSTVAGLRAVFNWFRIVWNSSAGTLTFDYSPDALTWTNIGSRASMSQPTEIGLGIYSNGGGAEPTSKLCVARFRVTTP